MTNGLISRIRIGKTSQNHSVRSDFVSWDNLETLRNADISACNAYELTDLRNVTINTEKSFSERRADFIAQVGNPYLFKVDDVVVKVEFGDGKDFFEILTDVILAG